MVCQSPTEPGRSRHRCWSVLLALALSAATLGQGACWRGRSSTLPSALSDEEFWRLSTSLSEPAGEFTHSENLVSNETQFVHQARLVRAAGGVYVGVGPEQNFSFIARLRPQLAFILDIRRENRSLHLVYKALFELSATRADFVSRLFSKGAAAGSRTGDDHADDLFTAYATAPPSAAIRRRPASWFVSGCSANADCRCRPRIWRGSTTARPRSITMGRLFTTRGRRGTIDRARPTSR